MAQEEIDIVIRERGARVVQRNLNEIGASANRSSSSVNLLRSALGLLLTSVGVSEIFRYADSWTKVTNQLKLATNSSRELAIVQSKIFAISQQTRTPLEATAGLYNKLTISGKELGASQNDLLTVVKSVGQAIAINGSTTAEASGALLQLSQAIGQGTVRAEEFNSILDGAKPVLITVANNLEKAGGSVARLRTLVLAGQVSSKEFFDALLKGSGELEKQFSKISGSIGQSFVVLQNSFTRFIGAFSESTKFDKIFANFIISISDSLNSLSDNPEKITQFFDNLKIAVIGLSSIVAARLAPSIIKSSASFIAATKSNIAFAASVLRGNATLIDNVNIEARRTASLVKNSEAELVSARATQTSTAALVKKAQVSQASTAATLAAAKSENALAVAERNSLIFTRNHLAAEREREVLKLKSSLTDKERQATIARLAETQRTATVITNQLAVAEARATETSIALTAAQKANALSSADLIRARGANVTATTALSAAESTNTALLARHQTALTRSTALTNIMSVASRGLSAALAFVGGPIGALVIAIGAAVTAAIAYRNEMVNIGGTQARVIDFAVGTWEFLQNRAIRAIDIISNAFQSFNLTINAVFTIAKSYVASFFAEVSNSEPFVIFSNSIQSIQNFVRAFANTAIAVFVSIGETIGIVAASIVNVFSSAIDKTSNIFSGFGKSIQFALAGDFKKAGAALSDGFSKEVNFGFTDAFNEISNTIKNNLERDFVGETVDIIGNAFSELKNTVEPILESIGNAGASVWQEIKLASDDALSEIRRNAQNNFDEYRQAAEKPAVVDVNTNSAESKLKTLSKNASDLLDNLERTFSSSIRSAFEGDFESIRQSFANLILDLIAQSLAADLRNALFPESKSGAPGTVDTLKGATELFGIGEKNDSEQTGMFDSLINSSSDAASSVAGFFTDAFSTIKSGIQSVITSVIDWGKSFFSVGSDAASTLTKTIPQGLQTVSTAQTATVAKSQALGAQQTATAQAQGAATAQAYAPAATTASLASFGSNAAVALLGILAVQAAIAAATKFATGGIVNSPQLFSFGGTGGQQLGVRGEAGPEAIVPLPDGRSIPVTMTNGQNNFSQQNVIVEPKNIITFDRNQVANEIGSTPEFEEMVLNVINANPGVLQQI